MCPIDKHKPLHVPFVNTELIWEKCLENPEKWYVIQKNLRRTIPL
jgi:hypothetical protein